MAQPNHLADSTNPYLVQHTYDLTDWYPWGEEAFARARAENKLIFLSIGYLTCPYCRKMQQESFNDPEIARELNDHFVAVKVDREERPDINHVFMMVVQHMTGRGGWPMHVLLTPDLEPIYSATYLPKEGYGNVPGLIDMLPLLSDLWRDQPQEVKKNARDLSQTIGDYLKPQAGERISHKELDTGADRLGMIFDANHGGFGPAPKFPLPHNLLFLMRYAFLLEMDEAGENAEKTLLSMYKGGIYDHIGFGFFRYSTDPIWMIPRFEKRLADNALLAYTYLTAYQYTEKTALARVGKETLTYMLRDLRAGEGGFYTAESTEAEEAEGLYYLWDEAEIKEILGFEAEMFNQYYNIGQAGTLPEFGKTLPNLLYQELDEAKLVFLGRHRQSLLAAREQRKRPLRDEKIQAGANGLALGALALGARLFPQEEEWLQAAKQTVKFIRSELLDASGNLAGHYYAGNRGKVACSADYAYLIWGLLELYQTTLEWPYLEFAVDLQKRMFDWFWNSQKGGFFFTAESFSDPKLPFRPQNFYDTDLPADNSVAALNLLRLARLTGNAEWQELGASQFETFGAEIRQNPTACSFWLYAASYYFYTGGQAVLVGAKEDAELQEMVYQVRRYETYDWLLLWIENFNEWQLAQPYISYLEKMEWNPEITGAYIVDRGKPAVAPIKAAEDLRFAMEQRSQFTRTAR